LSKNILELCLSPDLGGLELCVVDYFNYFTSKTQTYLSVAPMKKIDKYIESHNKFRLKRNKYFPFISAYKLAKFIDNNEIDIIHFHWTKDIATAVLAKFLSKRQVKLIQSRHMNMTRFKDDFYHKWLYKNIDTIHAVTQQVKEQLIKFIPQEIRPKIEIVYLGVDEPNIDLKRVEELEKEYALDDSFVIGIVGRIEEGKGQYIVIDALAKIKDLDIKLLIIGSAMESKYLYELQQKVKELEIENKVLFVGFTSEINEHIKLCDVTVLATKKETFGLVVIESMVNGIPVIATNNGGPLEIIDDGVDGLLFDRSSEDLTQKIEKIYSDKELKQQLSTNGYAKVKEKFNKVKQMEKMYEVLSES